MQNPFVLQCADGGEGQAIPATLEGLPQTVDGLPVHYRVVKIARVGPFTHRATGQQHNITKERADEWIKNTMALSAAGVEPFIPGQHRDTFNAADNYGYVKKVFRDGDEVKALFALYGDDARAIAARNGRSVYVVNDAKDSTGKVHKGESIAHVCLTPRPVLPNLGGHETVKIAASADGPARDVPVFVLSENSNLEPEMDPKISKDLRAKFGWGNDTPDEKLPELAAQRALALSADVETEKGKVSALTADRDKLTKERDDALKDAKAKGDKVLQLSADRPEPDPVQLGMFSELVNAKRDLAIQSGAVTPAEAKLIDGLIQDAEGQYTRLALSADGADKRPHAFKVWDTISKLGGKGIRTGQMPRPSYTPAQKNLAASADGAPENNYDDDFNAAKASRDRQLEARTANQA